MSKTYKNPYKDEEYKIKWKRKSKFQFDDWEEFHADYFQQEGQSQDPHTGDIC